MNMVDFDTSVFDISKQQVIEDEEYYYVFRALNDDDIRDLADEESNVIRTKGQVLRDNGETTRYGLSSQISLEEVYSNIRVARTGKDTNCVSFSSNPNVNLDYGNREYIMYAIPKNGDNENFLAGKYMLEEINKRISHKLQTTKINEEILNIITQIDSETDINNVRVLVGESLEKLRTHTGKMRFTGKNNKITSKESLLTRFERKQVFTEEQQLEYAKVVAKMTILETQGILRSILPTQVDNARLISALGGAFSSSEVIHYGSIPKQQVTNKTNMEFVDLTNMELFALLQQVKNIKDVDKKQIEDLKNRILQSVKNGQEIIEEVVVEETKVLDDFRPEQAIKYLRADEKENNIIPFYKGKVALEYIINYARAKARTYELIDGLRTGQHEYDVFLDFIQNYVIVPNNNIISRRNNSGIQISESVNLDMNPDNNLKLFSIEEQQQLIGMLNNLSVQEIEQIAKGNLSIIEEKKLLTTSIKSKKYLSDINEYYIDYIVDSLDLDSIYNSNVRNEKKSELRKKLVDNLKRGDVQKLYNAFIKAGIDYKEIPGFIVNLLFENGYGENSTFEQLSNSEDIDNLIKENIYNFNSRITPYSVDRFLEILDNNFAVPNTFIKLRDYQEEAVRGIDEIFESKNFAGVVLPTGAGKSFVAMTEMMNFQNKNIVYFAPQDEILNQFQRHILKNILGKTVLTLEDIDTMLEMSNEERREFLSSKVYNQDSNISELLNSIKNVSTDEEKLELKNKMLPRKTGKFDDIKDAIQTVFPHLDMYCYQSLNSSQYDKLVKKKTDLMILDELHRTGAETWRPLIRKLIESKPDCKILGVTATPVRDDKDHTDMMKYMAENYGGYSKEEIDNKAYLAEEMYLIDAMQNKYVVEPKIVSFNFILSETEEYKFVVETLKKEKNKNPNSELVKDLEAIKASMDEIINGEKKNVRNDLAAIKDVLTENIPENLKNGRFIVFLEKNPRGSNLESEDYVKRQIQLINQYFSGVNGDVKAGYLLSSRKDKKENEQAIQDFETLDNDQLKLLYAINMLNEGVHVENINGELMLRPIGSGSNILYFQQIGRVIYSIDPNNPPSEESIPIIFDVYNNYLTRDLDKAANMTTPTSDLNNIQMISNWINRHGRFPDINSKNYDEARKAITLKKIQEKYEKYLEGINNSNLSLTEKKEIEKILEIAKAINLFEEQIPERIIPPGEEELGRVRAFEVRGEVKKFLELFKQSKEAVRKVKKEVKVSNTLQIRNIMSILQTLAQYGLDLSDETFTELYKKLSGYEKEDVQDKAKENLNLLELIDNSFSDGTRDVILKELKMDLDELEDFKIYEEFSFARDAFLSERRAIRNIFSIYDIRDIRKCGLLQKNGRFIAAINNDGFVLPNGPEIFHGINIYTGTSYNEEGYNIEGYDAEGYNIRGFNRKGINKETIAVLEFKL